MQIEPVAYYWGALGSKFGIPRQSGLAPALEGRIVFEPQFRRSESFRGLEGFSHVWLIWGFSANKEAKGEWQPTVRPPRLGGNVSLGVWATRSPFRPNPLGLSCVEILSIDPDNCILTVRGADLMDGTPIYDVKPYVVYADSVPGARSGFAAQAPLPRLEVVLPESLPLDGAEREALRELLALDPRPAYQDDPDKEYGLLYAGLDIKFRVRDGRLTVFSYE